MPAIYLDYNATTPLAPAVAEALAKCLTPGLTGLFGNPSSSHEFGRRASAAVDRARGQVSGLLGCQPTEVIFTGSGSEADNLAIKGVAEVYADFGRQIITSQTEHPAVLNTCRYLERRGYRVTYLPVDAEGRVSLADLDQALTTETILVSIMHANNETGTVQPIAEIVTLAHQRGAVAGRALVHTDAAQSVGKLSTSVGELGVDLLTVAGHKLYAPKGIGALFVRETPAGRGTANAGGIGVRLEPLVHGAGHERGRRAGTENVPYIVALGEACAAAADEQDDYAPRARRQRDRLHELLVEGVPGLTLNGHPTDRLPNTLNVSFPGVDGEELLAATPEIAASTGSACHAGRTDPSAVLLAMGIAADRALGAVRLSLGKPTTDAEIEQAAAALIRSWRQIRVG